VGAHFPGFSAPFAGFFIASQEVYGFSLIETTLQWSSLPTASRVAADGFSVVMPRLEAPFAVFREFSAAFQDFAAALA
jgi:hypothetical protein